jgi:antitoxin MazE
MGFDVMLTPTPKQESKMVLQFAMWDDDVALRLPNEVAQKIHATDGARVDVTIEDGKVVLTPLESHTCYSLDELLAGITEENLHGETFAVAPVGAEILD